jgi:hypothetical protein
MTPKSASPVGGHVRHAENERLVSCGRGREPARSTVGDISTAAAGSASPASRVATSRATASPPPAESPATARDAALRCWSARSQRHVARTSSIAAGNGCSGASRYSAGRRGRRPRGALAVRAGPVRPRPAAAVSQNVDRVLHCLAWHAGTWLRSAGPGPRSGSLTTGRRYPRRCAGRCRSRRSPPITWTIRWPAWPAW